MRVLIFRNYAALLGTAAILCGSVGAAPARSRQTPEPRVVEIVAKKFAFVPARVEVSEGETVRLVVRSADGMHGIQIKKFKVSEEIPRGSEPITIEFTATTVGEFEIACSQFCGKGHEDMRGKLVVRARAAANR
jgi:cytochrome c oxidase subunit 2